MSNNDFVSEWLEKADEDYHAAIFLLKAEDSYLKTVSFLLQQAAEKYLKAYLTYKNKEFIKTHDIDYLLNVCAEFDNNFAEIQPKNLNDFAVDIRYPDFAYQPSMIETIEHKEIVDEIKELVQKLIKFN